MYFVNRSEIEKIINFIDGLLEKSDSDFVYTTLSEKLMLERLTHLLIESILDVGNLMIDGFIMRDPGSYHDIIDILIDERVLPKEDEEAYKQLIDLREQIVKYYTNINHEQIKEVLSSHKHIFGKFSTYIKSYLTTELGVANTFSNEEEGKDG